MVVSWLIVIRSIMRYCNRYRILSVAMLVLAAQGDLHAQAWRQLGDLHEGRNIFGAIAIGDGKVLVIGGYNAGGYCGPSGTYMAESMPTASCEIIDAVTESVSPAGSLNLPRAEAVYLLTPDSNVVAISGIYNDYGELTPSCELYDRKAGTWRVVGNLQVPRRQHTACFISNDEVLVVGGRHKSLEAMATAEIFNIRTGQSRLIADYMHNVSTPVSAVTNDGRIIVLSGRDAGENSFRSRNVYEYHRAADEWRRIGELPEAINVPYLMMLWNGDVLMAGGAIEESPLRQSDKVLRYAHDGFAGIGGMSLARTWHGQAQFGEESVIVTGGLTETQSATGKCEVIDLYTGTSHDLPDLHTPRRYLQTVSVPIWTNGDIRLKVLAIAGQGVECQTLASIEVFDVETPKYMARPNIDNDGDFLVSSQAGSYQWNGNGSPIAGATEQRFRPVEPGIYTVTIVKEGVITTSLPYFLTELHASGVDIENGNRFLLSSVMGGIVVNMDLPVAAPVTLELADMRGVTVMRLNEGIQHGSYSRELPMGDLPAGMYLLHVQTGDRSIVRKIVREE